VGEQLDLSGRLPDGRVVPASAQKPKARAAKCERLEARVTAECKRTIVRAAQLSGRSITDFVLESVRKSAHETILEHEVIRLNTDESRSFVRALLNPPKPNARLRTAFASHRKHVWAA
jgi:uncharacterized protein (DUF1778 family)